MELKKAAFITPNPSIGLIYFLDRFEIGSINRCLIPPIECADGKANIGARAFKIIGGEPIAIFPSGGKLGLELEKKLLEESILIKPVPIRDEIRRTYSFSVRNSDPPVETHLLEKGPYLSDKEQEDFIHAASESCKDVYFCVISGSLPGGCSPTFYNTLIKKIRLVSDSKIILDTSDLQLKYGISGSPDYLKINEEEFCNLVEIKKNSTPELIIDLMKKIGIENNISCIIVTRGSKSVFMWSKENKILTIEPPKVMAINTVGSGDCFTAGLIIEIDRGIESALKMAVATASSNVVSPLPGMVDKNEIKRLYEQVKITSINN